MSCEAENHKRIMQVSGKVSDMCSLSFNDIGYDGYVPEGLNLGGGDYLEFEFCLDCGTIMGNFPISDEVLSLLPEEAEEEE